MNKITKELSNRIVVINYILCFMIVCMHSLNKEVFNIHSGGVFIFQKIIDSITASAVPCFFLLSGILFYRNAEFKNIGRKLKGRMKSLCIPYVFWNAAFFAIYAILSRIDGISNYLNIKLVGIGPYDIFHAIIKADFTPLWFVKNLIVYSILSPIILVTLYKKNKVINMILYLIMIAIAVGSKSKYGSAIYWMPVYYMGCYIGYNKFDKINDICLMEKTKLHKYNNIYIYIYINVCINNYKYYCILG